MLDAIQNLSDALSKMSGEQLEISIAGILQTSVVLSGTAKTVKAQLNSACLSKNTYTK